MAETTNAGLRVERGAKRLRAYLEGELVVDTTTPWLIWETPYYPTYYLPVADLCAELIDTGAMRRDERLGAGQVFDIETSRGTAADAAVRYSDSPVRELRDLLRVEWAAMDEWLEEDEPVYTHPRDPYSRVDILTSSRHVRVDLDGQTVAESNRPTILFETGLPPRYYLPLSDVRLDLLHPSETTTHCPYKGTASYWSITVDGRSREDVAWTYRTPLPECVKIAGLVCFYTEKLDVYVNRELQRDPRPHPARPS